VQEKRIDVAEDRGIGADSESQRDHGNNRKSETFSQLPYPKTNVPQ
jgi:hypothetical protein